MKIRCAEVSIEYRACEGNTRHEDRKLLGSRHANERIVQGRRILNAEYVVGWSRGAHGGVLKRGTGIVDAITTTDDEPVRVTRRVCEPETRSKIVWIEAVDDVLRRARRIEDM